MSSTTAFHTFTPLHAARPQLARSLCAQSSPSRTLVPARASAAPLPTAAALSRRAFLALLGTTAATSVLSPHLPAGLSAPGAAQAVPDGPFALPPLPYEYNALEPHISEVVMRYHHDTHFNGYVKNLNAAAGALGASAPTSDAALKARLANLGSVNDAGVRAKLRNNGGGYLNHKQFFAQMSGRARSLPDDAALAVAIRRKFGSPESFKAEFLAAAGSLFGSGFTWLVRGADGSLQILTTPNQDNPVMHGLTPVLACDCWEHSWYSQYGPKKADYFPAWWNVIDWPVVNDAFVAAAHDL